MCLLLRFVLWTQMKFCAPRVSNPPKFHEPARCHVGLIFTRVYGYRSFLSRYCCESRYTIRSTRAAINFKPRRQNAHADTRQQYPHFVCVCVFVPSILTTAPPIKARRALHFAVYLEDDTCSVYFPVQLEPTGVTQEGVGGTHLGYFFFLFFAQPSYCCACLHFYREKGSAIPFPRQQRSPHYVDLLYTLRKKAEND